jgi:hypothetical protein
MVLRRQEQKLKPCEKISNTDLRGDNNRSKLGAGIEGIRVYSCQGSRQVNIFESTSRAEHALLKQENRPEASNRIKTGA